MIVLIVLVFVIVFIVGFVSFVIRFVLICLFHCRIIWILLKIYVGVIGRRVEISPILIKFIGRIMMDRIVWTVFSTQPNCIFSNHSTAQPSHFCNDPTQ